MSNRYKGGFITATPPTTTGGDTGSASGNWTTTQQMQAQAAGNWPSPPPPPYIEDVFSTWLYTGNSSTQTITNGIDLAGKGGMVWIKKRVAVSPDTFTSSAHEIYDTARGNNFSLSTNTTGAQNSGWSSFFTGFNSNGFGLSGNIHEINRSSSLYASWTFRKQAKFFDIVTFTSSASGNKTFSHNLGSVPGCVIIKNTQTNDPWIIYHRSNGDNNFMDFSTAAVQPNASSFSVTSTTVTVNANLMYNSQNYVAYLFAHDAGGFGANLDQNVISCGSYTGNGSTTGPTVNLGYEPQWLLIKKSSGVQDWFVFDNIRGLPVSGSQATLNPNNTGAENLNAYTGIALNATGFQLTLDDTTLNENGSTYIYIAIRRGPMKTPTTGTSVFDAGTRSGSASDALTNSDILTDLAVTKNYSSGAEYWAWTPRLVGQYTLQSNSTDAELSGAMTSNPWDTMVGAECAASNGATNSGSLIDYSFRRAPGFFDEVCYTGTNVTNTAIRHNLGVVPELVISKQRSGVSDWDVWAGGILGARTNLFLQSNSAASPNYFYSGTYATATNIYEGVQVGKSTATYVAYLFASCPGVSKVGSYTGTGTTNQINCGFTGGARFVLIKRTDSTGDWYVWDSARGIVAGNDPYLLLNSTAAQVTNTDYVDTYSAGFEISSTAPAAINANGGSFIYLAIA